MNALPDSALDMLDWTWEQYKPYADALLEQEVTDETVEQWLADWSAFGRLLYETYNRLYVALTVDTTDEAVEARFNRFIEDVMPEMQVVTDQLNRKLLESGLEPEALEVPLRGIRAQVEIFREANIPLFVEEQKLGNEYDKIAGAQTIEWEGEEKTLAQMAPVFMSTDREKREKAFRAIVARRLEDREKLNELWTKLFKLRQQVAANAGFDNFLEYQWKALGRFDYTPEDARRLQQSILDVVVPAVERINERRRKRMGLDVLKQWDLDVDPQGREALTPFKKGDELAAGAATIFNQVDPELGAYFQEMRDGGLLDLDNRKGKAPGGYCTTYSHIKKPFIFMNAVGIHDDVQTMLHEAGHAFHAFEAAHLPYMQQDDPPMEFAEVASMSMELLAAPYLTKDNGGFYSEEEAARARVEHLESNLVFWPYMAIVDAFQHWVYTSGDAAMDPANCDAKWTELWHQYKRGVDYTGLEDWVATGWQRKLHIYQLPFYYIEYGLAQLGATQVWGNSLKDQAAALNEYRQALSLGGTATLPDLFTAAGAKLAFDAETLGEAVALTEKTLAELDPEA
ncbi:M3 family oligoendopeptidase [Phototrophicus methaneseepsis]|uniref:M3 family oligoendopeptidase n=1 Tax=Phototrophicus methaneseepsis TaxID=2710758 RepID=A0A7S8EC91_9CHLR|nr:M3 family oligoendopeptidase [Phototrophicus methaneseepsis]QPC84322.1 M3 family oligoendopeptidase [Phototrophicus methaneseepsis]